MTTATSSLSAKLLKSQLFMLLSITMKLMVSSKMRTAHYYRFSIAYIHVTSVVPPPSSFHKRRLEKHLDQVSLGVGLRGAVWSPDAVTHRNRQCPFSYNIDEVLHSRHPKPSSSPNASSAHPIAWQYCPWWDFHHVDRWLWLAVSSSRDRSAASLLWSNS